MFDSRGSSSQTTRTGGLRRKGPARAGGKRSPAPGEAGNALIVSILLVSLLTALVTAQFFLVQKNSRHSRFVDALGALRHYAETGARIGLHELSYNVANGDGDIGTESWSSSCDLGRDGLAATGDEGEGGGIPTPGEPRLFPSAIGPSASAVGLLVHSTDTAWANIKRIVSTAFNGEGIAAVEVYARTSVGSMPGVAAVFVEPGLLLDLKGNVFTVDGNDTNPDGTPGPMSAVNGISTMTGDPPGSNASDLLDQIASNREDQILGVGGAPSVGESGLIDFDDVFNGFKASRTNVVTPGNAGDVLWGDEAAGDYEVTYCNGDLQLSGQGKGAGALVVEGSLTISGQFQFVGMILVRGDVRMTGGGSGIHLYGSALVGKSITAIDDDVDLTMAGNADIRFSSVGISRASALLGQTYTVLYWNDLK